MLDENYLSKPIPSMFTLNSNSQLLPITNNSNSICNELGQILRQHDPNAIRLYDYINQVKVFLYNSNEFHWENNPYIEGNLFVYERQQIYPSYAFMITNGEQSLIQSITFDMSEQVNKSHLFYEVTKNEKREIFCLHFINEDQCLRLHKFIQLIQTNNESRSSINIHQQENLIDLIPPSAFESNTINREHFRQVLLHLVQNNDQFLDIIYQACLSH